MAATWCDKHLIEKYTVKSIGKKKKSKYSLVISPVVFVATVFTWITVLSYNFERAIDYIVVLVLANPTGKERVSEKIETIPE